MKRVKNAISLSIALASTTIVPPASSQSVDVKADEDLGCQVLLCMANPNGAKALSECQPPMEKLAKRLAQGKSFPKCSMGGSEGSNYAEQRGDFVFIRVEGQPTRAYNWKTGQSYNVAGDGPQPPETGEGSGHVQQQVK